MKSTRTFSIFRQVAMAEGISFLLLLFIAMPLKYYANMPLAVTIVGGIHGVLVIAFVAMAWETKREYNKSWGWVFKALVASLLPFGTFVMDRQWKKEQADAAH